MYQRADGLARVRQGSTIRLIAAWPVRMNNVPEQRTERRRLCIPPKTGIRPSDNSHAEYLPSQRRRTQPILKQGEVLHQARGKLHNLLEQYFAGAQTSGAPALRGCSFPGSAWQNLLNQNWTSPKRKESFLWLPPVKRRLETYFQSSD